MNYPVFLLMLLMTSGLFFAGCTQSSGIGPVTPSAAVTTLPPAGPALAVPATTIPQPPQVVTIVHQVSRVRDVKDSELLFSLQVPVEWNLSTYRLENPENFEGSLYQTDLLGNNTFYIQTFTNYRSREQNYRDEYRRWVPAPEETVVTINGITFDRFESTADGRTNVSYVARKTSMNEHGYLSVLAFTADTTNRFEKEDYEKVVSSFRYFSVIDTNTTPGEEIMKIPAEPSSGNARSRSGSGSSGSAGSSGCGCGG
jgi:hypothetical protein